MLYTVHICNSSGLGLHGTAANVLVAPSSVRTHSGYLSVSCLWFMKLRSSPPPQPFQGPFFRDHPGEPVPEENFWTSWCKGRLTEADTLTIRLGVTPSGLTSAHLHHILRYEYRLSTDRTILLFAASYFYKHLSLMSIMVNDVDICLCPPRRQFILIYALPRELLEWWVWNTIPLQVLPVCIYIMAYSANITYVLTHWEVKCKTILYVFLRFALPTFITKFNRKLC